jgi:hypothetical protein
VLRVTYQYDRLHQTTPNYLPYRHAKDAAAQLPFTSALEHPHQVHCAIGGASLQVGAGAVV